MDSSSLPPEQPDLLQPRPPAPLTIPVQELEQQNQDLRTLLHATLVALLFLAAGVTLFLAKQMRMVRAEIGETRGIVRRVELEFKQKEPKMRAFVSALQAYAITHQDFQPILIRYRSALPQYFASPVAVNTAPVIAPTRKK